MCPNYAHLVFLSFFNLNIIFKLYKTPLVKFDQNQVYNNMTDLLICQKKGKHVCNMDTKHIVSTAFVLHAILKCIQ